MLQRQGQLQRFLRKLKNKTFFAEELDDKVYPQGHGVTPCSGSKPVSTNGALMDVFSIRTYN